MAIRIDLLSEARAAKEARRNNPVKRAIWICGFLVCVFLLWAVKLRLDIHFAKAALSGVQAQTTGIHAELSAASNNLVKIAQLDKKLAALDRLATNRFLWAPLLGTLEQTMVNDVRVTRFTAEQTRRAESSGAAGRAGGKAATSNIVEQLTLTIEARDTSPDEQACERFKDSLNGSGYFIRHLKSRDSFIMKDSLRVRLDDPQTNTSQSVSGPAASGNSSPLPGPGQLDSPNPNAALAASDTAKQFITFVLFAQFPEVRRGE